MSATPWLAMVAGEASGDLLAGLLMGGLRSRWPALRTAGIGGTRMAEHGFEAWWPHHKLAVRGYAEVLRHYREIKGIRDALASRLLALPPQQRPAAFVGIDAPDFNLGLEAKLKAGGIPSVHFVCPSIWAWRGGRAKRMAQSCDHVLCLFPFEPDLLKAHGVQASFVGHPLADAIAMQPPRTSARQALGLPPDAAVVALMPGSRRSELAYIAPRFFETAVWLHRQRPELRFVLPVVPGLVDLARQLQAQHAPGLALELLEGRSHEALAACDVTLIASGTATLEAALFKRPMVIAYNMHVASWHIMKRMRYQPWVGLPNILCREFVVPEFLQHDCRAEQLGPAVLSWLDDAPKREHLQRRFEDLHLSLRRDTASAASHAIAQVAKL